MLMYVPSLPAFWRVFYRKWVFNFAKAFSASIEIIISQIEISQFIIKKKKKNLLKAGIEGTYLNIIKPHMINPQQTLSSMVKK